MTLYLYFLGICQITTSLLFRMAFFEIALSSRHCECTKSSFMKGISSKHSFVYCIIITKILRLVHGIVSYGLPYFVKNKSIEI